MNDEVKTTRTSDPHERLRDDVRMLGGMLGETLRHREGAEVYETVERVRALSKSGRAGSDADLDAVAGLLRQLPVEATVPIARAFSHFLTLANIAEQHHRVRRRRAYQHDPTAPQQRPRRGVIAQPIENLESRTLFASSPPFATFELVALPMFDDCAAVKRALVG